MPLGSSRRRSGNLHQPQFVCKPPSAQLRVPNLAHPHMCCQLPPVAPSPPKPSCSSTPSSSSRPGQERGPEGERDQSRPIRFRSGSAATQVSARWGPALHSAARGTRGPRCLRSTHASNRSTHASRFWARKDSRARPGLRALGHAADRHPQAPQEGCMGMHGHPAKPAQPAQPAQPAKPRLHTGPEQGRTDGRAD